MNGVAMFEGLFPTKQFLTKEEYIYETLRNAILQCKIQPDEKLVIDQLAASLGVSTIPIRTVLQRLQIEGLVEIVPHTGAQVAGISLDKVEEIFSILGAFEGIALPAAARKIGEDGFKELEHLINEMDTAVAVQDANQWSQLNRQFHLRIAEIAQMPLLTDFTRRVFDQWERIRIYYLKDVLIQRLPQAQQEHHEIFELLRERRGDDLAAKSLIHNMQAKASYQQWINSHLRTTK
jgi:DNA-binding GntR family transcriptional regulator